MKTSSGRPSYRSHLLIPTPNQRLLLRNKSLKTVTLVLVLSLSAVLLLPPQVLAGTFFFSTGEPDGRMATLSRPAGAGQIQTETADDFVVTNCVVINHATFTGLIPLGTPLASVSDVEVELYHVFPKDSVDPPSGNVPSRVNSPGDVEIDSATRDGIDGTLSFTVSLLNPNFTAANSVVNGINKFPNQRTQGEGPVTGQEVLIDVVFDPPIALSPDHYFFRPEVSLSSGNFLWLSAPRPIVSPGTPFPPGTSDLQSWIRNDNLAPDWLRIGTDIVGGSPAPTFNAAFSLSGETDADCDGVADSLDLCADTTPGAIVDSDGCSIDQLAPCSGPQSGGSWKNHGQYVSRVAHVAEAFLAAGLISEEQKDAIVANAARSDCGFRTK